MTVEASYMEPMVVCALGIVFYCGYLTVRDILFDLQQEGIMEKVPSRAKNRKSSSMGTLVNGRRLRLSAA
jgi:hypothetical protein